MCRAKITCWLRGGPSVSPCDVTDRSDLACLRKKLVPFYRASRPAGYALSSRAVILRRERGEAGGDGRGWPDAGAEIAGAWAAKLASGGPAATRKAGAIGAVHEPVSR